MMWTRSASHTMDKLGEPLIFTICFYTKPLKNQQMYQNKQHGTNGKMHNSLKISYHCHNIINIKLY